MTFEALDESSQMWELPISPLSPQYFNGDAMVWLPWLQHLSSSVLSHVNTAAVIVFVIVFYLVSFYQKRRQLANIPPGPRPWPVVGNFGGFLIPSFVQRRFGKRSASSDTNAASVLTEQANVYGNVYSLFVGSQLVVVLNGYEAVKDALSNHPEVFSDRPGVPAISIMTKRKGEAPRRVEVSLRCNAETVSTLLGTPS